MINKYINYTLSIFIQYIQPFFQILPIYLQITLMTMISFITELPPLILVVYQMLQGVDFSIRYMPFFITGAVAGFYVADMILFSFFSHINSVPKWIYKMQSYMRRLPLLMFIICKIIPYTRAPTVALLASIYDKNEFRKYSLISSIILSCIIYFIMYIHNIYI